MPTDNARCPHGDPACPCPDGDTCHYRDYPAFAGWPASKALRAYVSRLWADDWESDEDAVYDDAE